MATKKKYPIDDLAAIEYHGVAGISLDCQAAVASLINSGASYYGRA